METVYDILLPADVREMLLTIQFTISIGIDGIPLACVGADGYVPRLVFWTVLPAVIVAVTSCLGAARVLLVTRCRTSHMALLEATMPAMLRIFFLSYPIVTNVAFEGELKSAWSNPQLHQRIDLLLTLSDGSIFVLRVPRRHRLSSGRRFDRVRLT